LATRGRKPCLSASNSTRFLIVISEKRRRGMTVRSRALGDAFVRQAKAKVADIQRSPQQYGRFFGEARCALLSRFPYIILFEDTEEAICFAGVLHTARDSAKWRERFN
jgi:hypothetical protein